MSNNDPEIASKGESKNQNNSNVIIHTKKHERRSSRSEVEKCNKEVKYLDTITITSSTVGIIIPEGATFMEILLIGGGGGGGNSGMDVDIMPKFGGGGGGGSGTYKNPNFCVTSGGSIDIEIGTGGLAGVIAGSNGLNGGNTTLTYGCFTATAFGGSGGQGSFNGSLGGKGGQGTGLGDFGDDGYTNIDSKVPGVNQQGGYGGLSGLCETSPYGNGGKGKDQIPIVQVPILLFARGAQKNTGGFNFLPERFLPDLAQGPARAALSFNKGPFNSGTFVPHTASGIERKFNIITSAATVKAPIVVSKGDQPCEQNTCTTTVTSVSPYNLSNDGTGGLAKLVFFSAENCNSSTRPNHKLRTITVKDNHSVYLVDPNTDLTVVDTSNFAVNLSLGRPRKAYMKITIKLAYSDGLDAYVMPFSGGTFRLSSTNPVLELVFDRCVWEILDNTENVNSFYPTTQQGAELTPYDFVGVGGTSIPSVALSSDGNIFIFGEPNDNGGIGAAWIYLLREGKWVRRSKLVGTGYVGTTINQGCNVALSADGNTAAVGGYNDNSGQGAVWIFKRQCGEWVQEGSKLVNPVGAPNYGFGYDLALSADGNTLIVGESDTPTGGGALIFTRIAGIWIIGQQLTPVPSSPGNFAGFSVDISADGTTAVLGSVSDQAWIFTTTGNGVWTQQGPVLTGPPGSLFGFNVSLSADGNTLVLGMPFYLSGQGGFASYIRVSGVWTQQGPYLTVPGVATQYQGTFVDLSADGNTLALSGNSAPNFQGEIYIWTRIGSNWSQATKLINSQVTTYSLKGYNASLSSDASTMVAAAFPLPGLSGTAIVYI